MKRYSFLTTLVFWLLIAPPHVASQSSPGESESKTLPQAENGVPLDRLIATVTLVALGLMLAAQVSYWILAIMS